MNTVPTPHIACCTPTLLSTKMTGKTHVLVTTLFICRVVSFINARQHVDSTDYLVSPLQRAIWPIWPLQTSRIEYKRNEAREHERHVILETIPITPSSVVSPSSLDRHLAAAPKRNAIAVQPNYPLFQRNRTPGLVYPYRAGCPLPLGGGPCGGGPCCHPWCVGPGPF